jgi:hypothetical protein
MTEGKDELLAKREPDDRAQMLQDFMEHHYARCLRASEWDAIVEFLDGCNSKAAQRLIALRAPVVDEGIVEAMARAMKPELFEGGPDSDRAPTVVYERNFCRQMARAALQEIQPILEGVKEECAKVAERRFAGPRWDNAYGAAGNSIAAAIRQVDVLPLGEEEDGAKSA